MSFTVTLGRCDEARRIDESENVIEAPSDRIMRVLKFVFITCNISNTDLYKPENFNSKKLVIFLINLLLLTLLN